MTRDILLQILDLARWAPSGDNTQPWRFELIGDEDVKGPLKVVDAPGHRFMDHPKGDVSIINLASVRDLEAKLGRPVDPLRFPGNVYVDGWPAWAEPAVGPAVTTPTPTPRPPRSP